MLSNSDRVPVSANSSPPHTPSDSETDGTDGYNYVAFSEPSRDQHSALSRAIGMTADEFIVETLHLSASISRIRMDRLANILRIQVYPLETPNDLVHAEIAALAQTLHFSLRGQYKIHATLFGHGAAVKTTRSEFSHGQMLMSDITREEATFNMQVKRKENSWNSLARNHCGLPKNMRMQILSPQECRITLDDTKQRNYLTVVYILMNFIHANLGMETTVLDYYKERRLTLRSEKYRNLDTKQESDRLMFLSEACEPSGNHRNGCLTTAKLLFLYKIRGWLESYFGSCLPK